MKRENNLRPGDTWIGFTLCLLEWLGVVNVYM